MDNKSYKIILSGYLKEKRSSHYGERFFALKINVAFTQINSVKYRCKRFLPPVNSFPKILFQSSPMSIEQRRFIRFSLDLPAFRFTHGGVVIRTLVQQISVGGCLTEWNDDTFTGDNFRLEMELPNKNRLPLLCKALYKFEGRGIGAKFLDITRFEQELIGQIISFSLESDGLPLLVDPLAHPPAAVSTGNNNKILAERRRGDEIVEEILSSNN